VCCSSAKTNRRLVALLVSDKTANSHSKANNSVVMSTDRCAADDEDRDEDEDGEDGEDEEEGREEGMMRIGSKCCVKCGLLAAAGSLLLACAGNGSSASVVSFFCEGRWATSSVSVGVLLTVAVWVVAVVGADVCGSGPDSCECSSSFVWVETLPLSPLPAI